MGSIARSIRITNNIYIDSLGKSDRIKLIGALATALFEGGNPRTARKSLAETTIRSTISFVASTFIRITTDKIRLELEMVSLEGHCTNYLHIFCTLHKLNLSYVERGRTSNYGLCKPLLRSGSGEEKEIKKEAGHEVLKRCKVTY